MPKELQFSIPFNGFLDRQIEKVEPGTMPYNQKVIRRENNAESQQILDENEPVFRGQCLLVMEALKRGERLTCASALLTYGIGDLRRRIKDLRDIYGVKTIREKILENRFKEWWIDCN